MVTESHHPANAENPPLLVGTSSDLARDMQCCPSAGTITAWSDAHRCSVLIATRCNRWTCPHCGRRKVARLAYRTEKAEPTKFITLTVWPRLYTNPREAYDETRRCVPRLITGLRKDYGEFESLRVLEATKKGWPHYHLIARCPFIPFESLRARWQSLSGARIINIKAVDKVKDVYWYMVKYLSKQTTVPWTNRRVSWTKAFFPKDNFKPPESLYLFGLQRQCGRPHEYAAWHFPGHLLVPLGPTCWAIQRPECSQSDDIASSSKSSQGMLYSQNEDTF